MPLVKPRSGRATTIRAVAGLLPIDAAVQRILAAVAPLEAQDVPVGEALHRVLAADVVAAHDVPPFANSAMDGFAVTPGPAGRRLRIAGESRARGPAPPRPGPPGGNPVF